MRGSSVSTTTTDAEEIPPHKLRLVVGASPAGTIFE
jgi:hypothetical protein